MTAAPSVLARGRAVVELRPDENAHARRPWSPLDRAAQFSDLAAWREAFRPAAPCTACAWPFALRCPCGGVL